MSQFEFEAILKIIHSGAPALAEELTDAFVKLVESERTATLRVEELEKQIAVYQRPCECVQEKEGV